MEMILRLISGFSVHQFFKNPTYKSIDLQLNMASLIWPDTQDVWPDRTERLFVGSLIISYLINQFNHVYINETDDCCKGYGKGATFILRM